MSAPRARRGGGIIAVVIAVAIGLGVSCNGFREDEIECEQTVVRLRDCCPGFDSRQVDCSYHESLDCSDRVTSRTYPALSLDDSRCLERKSCSDLIASGDCAAAQNAKRRVVYAGTSAEPPHDRVCAP